MLVLATLGGPGAMAFTVSTHDGMIGGMAYVDEFGTEWEREVAYVGALLKLQCPAPVEGQVVSLLIRVGSGNIEYQVAGSGASPLRWPPDPTWTEYGERCHCGTCAGRLVGASIDELRADMVAMNAVVTSNEDTYRKLRYLESARDVVVREAQNLRYGILRNTVTHIDTYVQAQRRVEVQYDGSFQGIEAVKVLLGRQPGQSYPATIAGAVGALQLPY